MKKNCSINTKNGEINKKWYVIDATDKILGRLATFVANRLLGKHKPEYMPNIDNGDNIIIINAKNIKVTGNKEFSKLYWRHTGYPGGIKSAKFSDLKTEKPCEIFTTAVKGMLPKGPLGRSILNNLKVFANEKHIHIAQNPEVLDVKY